MQGEILIVNMVCSLVPYIANHSRWKSFTDGQASSNLLENFRGLLTPLKMCSHA